jgi:hypothetical protein
MSLPNERNEHRNEHLERDPRDVVCVALTPDLKRDLKKYAQSKSCSMENAAVRLIEIGLSATPIIPDESALSPKTHPGAVPTMHDYGPYS